MKRQDDWAAAASLLGAGAVVLLAWAEAYIAAAIIGMVSIAIAAYLLGRHL